VESVHNPGYPFTADPDGAVTIMTRLVGFLALLLDRLYGRPARASGFPMIDYLIPDVDGITYEDRKRSFMALLRHLEPGVTQVTIHPAYDDTQFWETIVRSSPAQIKRLADRQAFLDADVATLIDELNIKVIGWREIRAAYFGGSS
jgi:hypothetical protein